MTPPFLKPRFWEWRDKGGNGTPGVGLWGKHGLAAHLTPSEARNLADTLHDMAEQIEAATPTNQEN